MIRKSILFAIFCLISGPFFFSGARAEILSSNLQVSVSDFQVKASSPGKITGSFDLTNVSGKDITDLTYFLTLQAGPVSKELGSGLSEVVIQPNLAKYQKSEVSELKMGEKKKFNFILDFPASINAGRYQIALDVDNQTGSKFYSADVKEISLDGSGAMLVVDWENCVLVDRDGEEQSNLNGILFEPGDTPEAKCKVLNPGDRAVEFSVSYETGILHILGYKIQETQKSVSSESYLLGPKEEKEISFLLPEKADPNIYESFVRFVEDDSNEVISPYLIFRWTIKGESARIDNLSVGPFDNIYRAGEKIKITMDFSPSADLYWRMAGEEADEEADEEALGTDLETVKITFTLYDKNNKICGSAEKTADFSEYTKGDATELIVASSCRASKIVAEAAAKDGKILTSYTLNFPSPVSRAGAQEKADFLMAGLTALLAGLLIVLLIMMRKGIGLKKTIIGVIVVLVFYLACLVFLTVVRADSGSLPEQLVPGGVQHRGKQYTDFRSQVINYDITNYRQGGTPDRAQAFIVYCGERGFCANDDARVFLTFKMDNLPLSVKKINNKASGKECGTYLLSFLSSNWVNLDPAAIVHPCDNLFPRLEIGRHELTIDSRLVISHANADFYPAGQEESKYIKKHACGIKPEKGKPKEQAKDEAELLAYRTGWAGSGSYSVCGDGKTVNMAQYNYDPLVFNLPFTVYEPSLRAVPTSATINVGDKQDFNALYDFDGPSLPEPEVDVTADSSWILSDGNIGQIVSTANSTPLKVEGKSEGSTNVVAQYQGLSAQANLDVIAVAGTQPLAIPQEPDPDYCLLSPEVILFWAFRPGSSGGYQTGYEIQIDSNINFSSPLIIKKNSQLNRETVSMNQLKYNTPYYWRIKVTDSKGNESDWAQGDNFATPRHKWPTVEFSWMPENPQTGEPVVLQNQSVCYDDSGSPTSCAIYSWKISVVQPSGSETGEFSSTERSPSIQFSSEGQRKILLTVTDRHYYSCNKESYLFVGLGERTIRSIKWREIQPF